MLRVAVSLTLRNIENLLIRPEPRRPNRAHYCAQPGARGSIAIGDCTSDGLKQVDAGSKVKTYKMDPVAERTLQRFFAPYNKQLVAVLQGYDPAGLGRSRCLGRTRREPADCNSRERLGRGLG